MDETKKIEQFKDRKDPRLAALVSISEAFLETAVKGTIHRIFESVGAPSWTDSATWHLGSDSEGPARPHRGRWTTVEEVVAETTSGEFCQIKTSTVMQSIIEEMGHELDSIRYNHQKGITPAGLLVIEGEARRIE